jgi:hypothetical protein
VTSTPPTTFENYPPEPAAGAEGNDGITPLAASDASGPVVPAPTASGSMVSRRTVFGIAAGGLAVLLAGAGAKLLAEADRAPREDGRDVASIAGYTAVIPAGWHVRESSASRLLIQNGGFLLAAYPQHHVPRSIRVADELPGLVRRALGDIGAYSDGSLAAPADMSDRMVKRAVLSGTGTYRDGAATLWADLWVKGRDGLLVLRISTGAPGTPEAVDLEQMSDDLSEGFR